MGNWVGKFGVRPLVGASETDSVDRLPVGEDLRPDPWRSLGGVVSSHLLEVSIVMG